MLECLNFIEVYCIGNWRLLAAIRYILVFKIATKPFKLVNHVITINEIMLEV